MTRERFVAIALGHLDRAHAHERMARMGMASGCFETNTRLAAMHRLEARRVAAAAHAGLDPAQ